MEMELSSAFWLIDTVVCEGQNVQILVRLDQSGADEGLNWLNEGLLSTADSIFRLILRRFLSQLKVIFAQKVLPFH